MGQDSSPFGTRLTAPLAPQGLGQGNGAAPTTWPSSRTPLLNQLREAGHALIFKCNISEEKFHLVGCAFVDDTTLVSVAPSPDWDTDRVVQHSKKGLDIYVGGVRATGGTVHPYIARNGAALCSHSFEALAQALSRRQHPRARPRAPARVVAATTSARRTGNFSEASCKVPCARAF